MDNIDCLEEYDKQKTKVLKYIIYKKRTEREVRQKFEIEKSCKNKAYYFILSSGNFQKFAEFHKKHRANLDYHGACLAQLYLDSFTTK